MLTSFFRDWYIGIKVSHKHIHRRPGPADAEAPSCPVTSGGKVKHMRKYFPEQGQYYFFSRAPLVYAVLVP